MPNLRQTLHLSHHHLLPTLTTSDDMYLSGSKWNTGRRRPRGSRPWRVLLLVILIGGIIYLERVVVPSVPPLFIPTLTPTRSPASFVLEAESFFEAGKLTLAADAYQQAVEVDPDEPAYYIELARIQVFEGDYDAAEASARNALLIEPESPTTKAVLGWVLQFKGEYLDAERLLEEALLADPGLAIGHAYYAEVLMNSDVSNYERALSEGQRAVELDPNSVDAHRSLGYVWESTENYEFAFDEYETALRINPNLAVLHLALGNMYLTEGAVEDAVQSYLRASSLAPNDTKPYSRIALAYARVGEFGKASQYAADAVRQDTADPFLHGDLGRMFYKNNEYDRSIEEFEMAIKGGETLEGIRVEGLPLDPADPSVVEFYYMYGFALARTQQCSLAIDIFNTLLTGTPDNELAVFNATEGLKLCGEAEPTPEAELTPTATP